jgi:hypothetical protein
MSSVWDYCLYEVLLHLVGTIFIYINIATHKKGNKVILQDINMNLRTDSVFSNTDLNMPTMESAP